MVAAPQFGREELEEILIPDQPVSKSGTSTGSPLRGGQRISTVAEDARTRSITEYEGWQRRAASNRDPLKLFATLKEVYPLIV